MGYLDVIYMQYRAIAEELAATKTRDSEATQRRICKKHGVDYDLLSDADCEWIKSMIKSYL